VQSTWRVSDCLSLASSIGDGAWGVGCLFDSGTKKNSFGIFLHNGDKITPAIIPSQNCGWHAPASAVYEVCKSEWVTDCPRGSYDIYWDCATSPTFSEAMTQKCQSFGFAKAQIDQLSDRYWAQCGKRYYKLTCPNPAGRQESLYLCQSRYLPVPPQRSYRGLPWRSVL
jgi:hypothetical protein